MFTLDVRNCLFNTQNLLSIQRLFVGKGKCRSLFLDQGTGRRCRSTRKRTVMRKMAMSTTVVVVAEVPMKEQAEAQVLAGVTIVSVAAAAGGITVPRGSGVFHRVLNTDRKSLLLHPGLPRSPLSSPAKMKVGNTCRSFWKVKNKKIKILKKNIKNIYSTYL